MLFPFPVWRKRVGQDCPAIAAASGRLAQQLRGAESSQTAGPVQTTPKAAGAAGRGNWKPVRFHPSSFLGARLSTVNGEGASASPGAGAIPGAGPALPAENFFSLLKYELYMRRYQRHPQRRQRHCRRQRLLHPRAPRGGSASWPLGEPLRPPRRRRAAERRPQAAAGWVSAAASSGKVGEPQPARAE